MPDIERTTKLMQGFDLLTDSGYLKQEDMEYNVLQNIRGWGGLGNKRRGVQTLRSFESAVMGFMDCKVDGTIATLNKILVQTGDGSLWFLDPIELVTAFDFMQTSASKLYLQDSASGWWDCTPGATTGLFTPTGVTYSGATISTDFIIGETQSYAFQGTSVCYQLYLDPTTWAPTTKEYLALSGVTEYSTTRAFTYGHGLVFTQADSTRYRLGIDSSGTLFTEQI